MRSPATVKANRNNIDAARPLTGAGLGVKNL